VVAKKRPCAPGPVQPKGKGSGASHVLAQGLGYPNSPTTAGTIQSTSRPGDRKGRSVCTASLKEKTTLFRRKEEAEPQIQKGIEKGKKKVCLKGFATGCQIERDGSILCRVERGQALSLLDGLKSESLIGVIYGRLEQGK